MAINSSSFKIWYTMIVQQLYHQNSSSKKKLFVHSSLKLHQTTPIVIIYDMHRVSLFGSIRVSDSKRLMIENTCTRQRKGLLRRWEVIYTNLLQDVAEIVKAITESAPLN